MKSSRCAILKCPRFDSIPRAWYILAMSCATVVLPIPGEPYIMVCRYSSEFLLCIPCM